MLTLPLALTLEKNKLIGTAPWLILLSVTLPDTTVIRLARNVDDVVFNGNTYTAFAFDLGDVSSGGDGRIQSVSLKVANPARALQPFLEEYSGLVGCNVQLMVVHTANLASDYTELTLSYDVLSSDSAEDWITFTLGAQNPLRQRFPLQAAIPFSCNWGFQSAECAYSGAATSCARTLVACQALNNVARFGGRPGISGAPMFAA